MVYPMKRDNYTEIICRRFCGYYKEGKEEMTCGTYNFLARELTLKELASLTRDIQAGPDFSFDKEIKCLVCDRCDFLADGCDFRDGLNSRPCGGYTVIEKLIKAGVAK